MKKPIKDKLILSWHFLGYKHEVLCEKLGVYLEEKKKSQTTGSGIARRDPKVVIENSGRFVNC